VVWALREGGAAEISVWNRTPERAAALAAEFGVRHVARPQGAELIVNTTSVGLGATGEHEAVAALGLREVEPPALFVDLVYGPEPTALCRWASGGGARVVEGLEVLVRQGGHSVERWTGRQAPLEVMREAAGG
jgi:shikimate dehydrogenase